MQLIILAAGQGARLRPYTASRPKCLVELHGQPLINWQLEAARAAGISAITIVGGWQGHMLEGLPGVSYIDNPNFATTNMVETLLCARHHLQDEVIISYGDIVYGAAVLQRLLSDQSPIGVMVDVKWRQYWKQRFEDPLSDAETLCLDKKGRILEIGQRPKNYDQVQAQYIGLMAFRSSGLQDLLALYDEASADEAKGVPPFHGERRLHELYMTDMLQALIARNIAVQSLPITRGWLEIDSAQDLAVAHQNSIVKETLEIIR